MIGKACTYKEQMLTKAPHNSPFSWKMNLHTQLNTGIPILLLTIRIIRGGGPAGSFDLGPLARAGPNIILFNFHHHHLHRLSLLAQSSLKHQSIFVVFLDHVFLSVDNIKVASGPFLAELPADVPGSFSSFAHFFVRPPHSQS